MLDFSHLNSKQFEAVQTLEGPVLILAGAGSGKTTVLVNRIANILDTTYTEPYKILAITFTNKAAAELKERLSKMLGDAGSQVFAATFHSACVRFLRRDIDKIGYTSDFSIFDRADQQNVIKEVLKELEIDDKNFPPKMIINNISKLKDDIITPEKAEQMFAGDFKMRLVSRVYKLYQNKLKKYNALDFDDIIIKMVQILEENEDILQYYQNRFKYIMVDEYQDTNNLQYRLIELLAGGHRNLCVVGDDDQSIYKFRGANIENILSFEKKFPEAKVIKLEENYRSTQNILDAANNVIKNNRGRKDKSLWTNNGKGEKISVYTAQNEYDEAYYIANKIEELKEADTSYNDFAILYRTNAQSRVIEDMLVKNAIPYRVLGGLRFFDRAEIKDIIAYLRLINNNSDNISFKRIVNTPRRGIGATTISKLEDLSASYNTSMFEGAKALGNPKVIEFCNMINHITTFCNSLTVSEFVEKVLLLTGYTKELEKENTPESNSKLENIKEFINSAVEYEKGNENPTLSGFLEQISLVADVDNYDETEETVVLMTLHSAKGLEFPIVFMAGVEEGLFPSFQSIGNEEDLEEERRLAYVGITRAKKKLFITNSFSRTIYNQTSYNKPSRFIEEIPEELFEVKKASVIRKNNTSEGFTESKIKYNTNFNSNFSFNPKPETLSVDFNPGERVKHGKFGEGLITKVTKIGNDYHLEIAFDKVGTKKLMAAYAKLKKL